MLLNLISSELGLEPDYVQTLANTASRRYKVYQIRKRTKGFRTIHHPSKELKALQRWITQRVLSLLPVHEAVTAYERGSSIRKNAERHAQSSFSLRMDFEGFFPSITRDDVGSYLASHQQTLSEGLSSWTEGDARLLSKIACRQGKLTIGAVTSPSLSNRICYELDDKISKICRPAQVRYSRYADDLFFSTTRRDTLRNIEAMVKDAVSALECPGGLAINESKTLHMSKKGKRSITGLILSSDGKVSIGRDLKRSIRTKAHLYDSLDAREQIWLSGILAYCRDVEPGLITSLYLKFGSSTVDKILSTPSVSTRTERTEED